MAVAIVATLASRHDRSAPVTTDARAVAIAPFRVTGADSSLAYLREGMVDLLAAKLGGTTDSGRSIRARCWRPGVEPATAMPTCPRTPRLERRPRSVPVACCRATSSGREATSR